MQAGNSYKTFLHLNALASCGCGHIIQKPTLRIGNFIKLKVLIASIKIKT